MLPVQLSTDYARRAEECRQDASALGFADDIPDNTAINAYRDLRTGGSPAIRLGDMISLP